MSGALAEVRGIKEHLNVLMGSERMFFIGKLRDVQLGDGFGPFLFLSRKEEVCIPGCFHPNSTTR